MRACVHAVYMLQYAGQYVRIQCSIKIVKRMCLHITMHINTVYEQQSDKLKYDIFQKCYSFKLLYTIQLTISKKKVS